MSWPHLHVVFLYCYGGQEIEISKICVVQLVGWKTVWKSLLA